MIKILKTFKYWCWWIWKSVHKKLNKTAALKSVNIHDDNSMRDFVNEVLQIIF